MLFKFLFYFIINITFNYNINYYCNTHKLQYNKLENKPSIYINFYNENENDDNFSFEFENILTNIFNISKCYKKNNIEDFILFFLNNIKIQQPTGDWASDMKIKRYENNINIQNKNKKKIRKNTNPYQYLYLNLNLKENVYLLLKIEGLKTNYIYDWDQVLLLNQGDDWNKAFSNQEQLDMKLKPFEFISKKQNSQHYFPFKKPYNYIYNIFNPNCNTKFNYLLNSFKNTTIEIYISKLNLNLNLHSMFINTDDFYYFLQNQLLSFLVCLI